MIKNATLRLDVAVLSKARPAAFEQDRSLSEWVAGLVTRAASEADRKQTARANALQHLSQGLHLGGTLLSREDSHGRRS